jgi:hypothetical protein
VDHFFEFEVDNAKDWRDIIDIIQEFLMGKGISEQLEVNVNEIKKGDLS